MCVTTLLKHTVAFRPAGADPDPVFQAGAALNGFAHELHAPVTNFFMTRR